MLRKKSPKKCKGFLHMAKIFLILYIVSAMLMTMFDFFTPEGFV